MATPRDFNLQTGFVAKRNPLTMHGVVHTLGQEFDPTRFGLDERATRRLWDAGHITSRVAWEAAGHAVIPAPEIATADTQTADKPRRGRPPKAAA